MQKWVKLHVDLWWNPRLRIQPKDVRCALADLFALADEWGLIDVPPTELKVLLELNEKRMVEILGTLERLGILYVRNERYVVKEIERDKQYQVSRVAGGAARAKQLAQHDAGDARQASPLESGSGSGSGADHPNGAPPPKPKEPPKPPTPRKPSGAVQTFIALWLKLFREEVFDAAGSPVEYGALSEGDGAGVARLCRSRPKEVEDLELVERRMLALLRSPDPFWLTNRNLRTLCSRWTDVASLPIAEANRQGRRFDNGHEDSLKAILEVQRQEENAHGLRGSGHSLAGHRPALGGVPANQDPPRSSGPAAGAAPAVPRPSSAQGSRPGDRLFKELPEPR